ncbi:MAG: acyl-CoA dehydrogenase family protein [Nitrospira sp.]|uniref:Acyl-CoA dehydrogenase FadE10 n=1 Tax=Nitrospira defluvii TaxID=330214 RepID=A0ABM8R324_9BACT|nr:acyl-CoA dehydrogenase family protein [Nitrospira defluvii]MCS6329017.1 acyl-CoA dehydrogenase family protein [Nitrospira sp.]CAE6730233.1 putative acyl-CoA dehydrogenase FadE10 [Nitrospira defluvii]
MATRGPLFNGSLAAAEAARDTRAYSGFISGLFEGKVRRHLFADIAIPATSEAANVFLDRLRRVLIERVNPEAIDREGAIGEDVFAALRGIGAFGIKIPCRYGGLGLSQSEYHAVATLLGSHDAATTVLLSAHNSIGAAEPVKLVGNQEQQTRWLPRLAKGTISGFALTEKAAGCDIWDLHTYAIPIHEGGELVGYRLTGDKLYTTNAPRGNHAFLASLLVVIAQIVDAADEVHRPKEARKFGAFLVNTQSQGCHCTRLSFMGVRGIYNGQVHLREVFVPVADRLGEEGDGLRRALESLTVGRLTLPAACLGNLKQCLWFARQRAQERVQYDRPIGEHTDIGAKLVLMASRVLALEAIVKITGIWADSKQDVRLESAAAKILATEWLLESLLDLFRIYGGRAFETPDSLRLHGDVPVPVERMIRDALINVIWEGTNGILTLWIGREGLAEFLTHGQAFLDYQVAEMLRAAPFFMKTAARSVHALSAFEKHGGTVGTFDRVWEPFVARKSRELAQTTLWVAIRDRQGLARKQLLTNRLVKAAMHLFAVETLLWYKSREQLRDQPHIQSLVTYFCSKVKGEFDPSPLLSWRTSGWDDDTYLYPVAKAIVSGRLDWLEEGIIRGQATESGVASGAERLVGASLSE